MIAPMIRAAIGDQLPPAQLDRLCQLVGEVTERMSMFDMIATMGELMAVQTLMTSDVGEAIARVRALADKHNAHELAAFMGELFTSGSTQNPV